PDISVSINTAPLPESLAGEIAALDGVERVDKLRFIVGRAGGLPAAVLAWSFPEGKPLPLPLAEGEPAEVARGLARGEVVLATVLAQRLGLRAGDAVTVQTAAGDQDFRVAGTMSEYTGGGMALYMDWQAAKRAFRLDGAHAFVIAARPGMAAAVERQLRPWCRERGLLMQSNAETRAAFDEQTGGFLGFIRVLIALALVVAFLGV